MSYAWLNDVAEKTVSLKLKIFHQMTWHLKFLHSAASLDCFYNKCAIALALPKSGLTCLCMQPERDPVEFIPSSPTLRLMVSMLSIHDFLLLIGYWWVFIIHPTSHVCDVLSVTGCWPTSTSHVCDVLSVIGCWPTSTSHVCDVLSVIGYWLTSTSHVCDVLSVTGCWPTTTSHVCDILSVRGCWPTSTSHVCDVPSVTGCW